MNTYYIAGVPYTDELYHTFQEGTTFGRMDANELYHYGIKGQSWGRRRFQNDDGSLTAAGRSRYDVGPANGFGSQLKQPSMEYLREKASNSQKNNYFGRSGTQAVTSRVSTGGAKPSGSSARRETAAGVRSGVISGRNAADKLFKTVLGNRNGGSQNLGNQTERVIPEAMQTGRVTPENIEAEHIETERVIPERTLTEQPQPVFPAPRPAQKKPGLLDRARDWASDRANDVGNAVSGAVQGARDWASDRANDVGNAVSGAVQGARDWAGNAVRDVRDFATGTSHDVSGKLQNAAEEARRTASKREIDEDHGNPSNAIGATSETGKQGIDNNQERVPAPTSNSDLSEGKNPSSYDNRYTVNDRSPVSAFGSTNSNLPRSNEGSVSNDVYDNPDTYAVRNNSSDDGTLYRDSNSKRQVKGRFDDLGGYDSFGQKMSGPNQIREIGRNAPTPLQEKRTFEGYRDPDDSFIRSLNDPNFARYANTAVDKLLPSRVSSGRPNNWRFKSASLPEIPYTQFGISESGKRVSPQDYPTNVDAPLGLFDQARYAVKGAGLKAGHDIARSAQGVADWGGSQIDKGRELLKKLFR